MGVRDQYELPVDALRWRCDPRLFAFDSTAEIGQLQEFVGQDRALRALQFGLAIDRPGYNIFATGLAGTGRASAVRAHLSQLVARRQLTNDCPVSDWCYVYNPAAPDRPCSLRLPAGRGGPLRAQMDNLVRALRQELARAFAQETYAAARQQAVAAPQAELQELWRQADVEARQAGFVLQMTPTEVNLVPLLNGKPAETAAVEALSEAERADLEKRHDEAVKVVGETMKKASELQRQGMEAVAALDQRVTTMAVAGPFDQVAAQYQDLPEVLDYLQRVHTYTLENLHLFVKREPEGSPDGAVQLALPPNEDPYRAYRVNLFVDRSGSSSPPIVIESNPTYSNLFGRVERRAVMGGMVTDHTLIRPGALAQANGGYLVTEAREVFANPGVWPALKRALRDAVLRIEDGGEAPGLITPPLLRPEPIALDLKVILVGDDGLYRLARASDPDFWEVFKVKAEFDAEIERTTETIKVYASFIARTCETDGLLHFDRTGVAGVVEHAARMVGDQNLLSTRFGLLRDLLIEADHYARLEGQQSVSAAHVEKAIHERVWRVNLVQTQIQEYIVKGVLLVDVDGSVVGQVNGLGVFDLLDLAFGQPTRITASVYAGRTGVINVEREAKMSGRSHDKGLLILTGYLGERFAQQQPFALSASVCFEQSYEGVDGDSASSTELYALLSSLAELPIDQSLAVTGSVNQKGEIQAIGGVNEKVEGFYDVCRLKGLTGRQGVLVPRSNAQHLMLRPDVVEAVAAGRFHVYAVGSVAEGIELLTGVPMGQPDDDGVYPEGTVGQLVATRLKGLAEAVRQFDGHWADTGASGG